MNEQPIHLTKFMGYDPEKHHRRSIRLRHYDYRTPGRYFVTICTYQRLSLFGDVVDGEMQINAFGKAVNDCWQAIPQHFSYVSCDAFVVMPNHVHGIVVIDGDMVGEGIAGEGMAVPCPNKARKFGKPIAGSLPTIVGSFKSAATKRINQIRDAKGSPVWQRNYYERIIRDEAALTNIRRYIRNNPAMWHEDQLRSPQSQ